MAHLKFFNAEYSEVTGLIRRGMQLVRNQMNYLVECPQLADRHYRSLQAIDRQLDHMSRLKPIEVKVEVLQRLLNDLSSIIRTLQQAERAA
ncbi:hypothetical protein [Tengunoibacter tsumagoiensis]|uniref:Uncharacterized protein n=1 Tax=Tengunoibacter tsumagoiensis TaxID=2014871 RepID=A0A401ZUB6_9CHLR|nr:hypothetical protein [Tengunoibacter tsumagoiensis]GCE10461.1 hypothetical protein KTT_03200 [Tengunoibacter tsumagoiensis]